MATAIWNFDPAHTAITFRIRHAAISWVRGSFGKWDGTLTFDPEHPENVIVTFNVDLASVDTGVPDRDEHLRSADFFDVSNTPTMTFTSTRAVPLGGDEFKLDGRLTLHGVTRLVTLDVTYGGTSVDPYGIARAGFEARMIMDRRDYGLIWNATMESAGHLVGDTVEVNLEIEAMKA